MEKPKFDSNSLEYTIDKVCIEVNKSGEIKLSSKDKSAILNIKNRVRNWIVSYINCIGCGICRKYFKYLEIKNDRVYLKKLRKASEKAVTDIIENCPVNEVGIAKFTLPLSGKA